VNPFRVRFRWAWYLGGMLLFGIVSYWLAGPDSRNLWGALGGMIGLAVGGALGHWQPQTRDRGP